MTTSTEQETDKFSDKSDRRFRWSRWLSLKSVGIAFLALFVVYFGYLSVAYGIFYGRDIYYPQKILSKFTGPSGGGQSQGSLPAAETEQCEPSRTVAMQIYLIDLMVNENVWVPSSPLYKAGFFGVVSFDDTPWFDNKAAEQIGMLDVARRLAIELTDSLGRVRGTSAENEQLTAAQAALRIDENAWYLNNPFSGQINTISPSAADSYRRAIPLYESYNRQLANCDAVFDARSDNLRETLSRFTATLGSTIIELAQRSQESTYDVELDRFVPGEGNSMAWLDVRADNHFHRARGKMYALHGLLQGMRSDFSEIIADKNLKAVWDKMEASVAEAALLDPMIVSNGSKDGIIFPDHLGVMAELILRSRTSMVELRDILAD